MESLTDVSMERKRELLADASDDELTENEKSSNNRSGQRLLVIKMAVKLVV